MWWSLENSLKTHFCKSWSRKFQVSFQFRRQQVPVTRLLPWDFEYCNNLASQNFCSSMCFCLLHLHAKKTKAAIKKCHTFKTNSTSKRWWYFLKICRKKVCIIHKFAKLVFRIFWWSLGLEGYVSITSLLSFILSQFHNSSQPTKNLPYCPSHNPTKATQEMNVGWIWTVA